MADKMDMSLEDIIKLNRSQRGAAAGAGPRKGRLPGQPWRQGAGRCTGEWRLRTHAEPAGALQQTETASRQVAARPVRQWLRGWCRRGDGWEAAGVKSGFQSVRGHIQKLFAEFGTLKKAAGHYDHSGRSLGTADVHFEQKADALKALKQYNGCPFGWPPHEHPASHITD
ncbi:Aly/REF export factor 2 [Sciurus carolinensis]|uniref:Aly/REF export factor 2 n=1 Tax=Sciurus carolinensis TaxID=30640 RepID=A0AA41TA36_SCICA|nr:Aly/REF export factor 2 [Sciurus carolinensis]